VLQEQEVEPLGSNRVERVDVRVIAATSRDLGAMVSEGRFRADLYYRLNVLPLRLPPLRERLDDIPALAEAFAEEIVRRSALEPRSLAPDALAWLARQRWPGNIRELRNVLEQCLLMTDDDVITAAHFEAAHPAAPAVARAAEPSPAAPAPSSPEAAPTTLADQVASLELAAIRDALAATGGNRLAAAKLLKISRATLYERFARYPELNDAAPRRGRDGKH
jgi:DNA-binding NtrC family response regulator